MAAAASSAPVGAAGAFPAESWHVWETRDAAAAQWMARPAAERDDSAVHTTAFDDAAALVGSQAAAQRWRWARGLALLERQEEAHALLAGAFCLWNADHKALEDGGRAAAGARGPGDEAAAPLAAPQRRPPNLQRFVRRARRRGALPGWWALDASQDDQVNDKQGASALDPDAPPETVAAMRALAAEVYGRAPGDPPVEDDSEAEDALSDDGSLEGYEETPAEAFAADSKARKQQRCADWAVRAAGDASYTVVNLSRQGSEALASGNAGLAVYYCTQAIEHPGFAWGRGQSAPAVRAAAYVRLRRWRRAARNATMNRNIAAPGEATVVAALCEASVLYSRGRVTEAASSLLLTFSSNCVEDELASPEMLFEVRRRLAQLIVFRPEAEHCAAMLRFVLPLVAVVAPELVRLGIEYSAACIREHGKPAALEFDACGGSIALRCILAACCGVATPYAAPAEALRAQLERMVDANQAVSVPMETELELTTTVHAALAIAAFFEDVPSMLAMLETGSLKRDTAKLLAVIARTSRCGKNYWPRIMQIMGSDWELDAADDCAVKLATSAAYLDNEALCETFGSIMFDQMN